MKGGRRARGARFLLRAVLIAALASPSAATAHRVPLERAQALVRAEALGVVAGAALHFTETRTLGPPASTEAFATCRRVSDHVARCRWRAASYWSESYAVACAGRAEVRLVGARPVAVADAAACQH